MVLGADCADSAGKRQGSSSQRSGVGSGGIGSSNQGSGSGISSGQRNSSVSVDGSWVCVEGGDGGAVAGPQGGLAVEAETVETAGVGNSDQSGEQNLSIEIIV